MSYVVNSFQQPAQCCGHCTTWKGRRPNANCEMMLRFFKLDVKGGELMWCFCKLAKANTTPPIYERLSPESMWPCFPYIPLTLHAESGNPTFSFCSDLIVWLFYVQYGYGTHFHVGLWWCVAVLYWTQQSTVLPIDRHRNTNLLPFSGHTCHIFIPL